jgi:hypothetical protein
MGVAILAVASPSMAEKAPQSVIEMLKLRYSGRPTYIRSLSDDERAEALAYYRARAESASHIGSEIRDYLFLLGDEEEIEMAFEDYKDRLNGTRVSQLLAVSGDAKWIERMIEPVFVDEPLETIVAGDTGYEPFSLRNARDILKLAGNSPDFNSDVINWARRAPRLILDLSEIRDMVREWWTENEEAFRRKEFKAVKPGPDYTDRSAKRAEARGWAFNDRLAAFFPPAPSATPNEIPSTPPPAVIAQVPASTATAQNDSWLGFAIAGGCALLLALAVWMQARRAG